MTDPVKVLSDDALREIEARAEVATWQEGDGVSELLSADIPALCATVRALRMKVAQAEQAFELDAALKLSEVGNLNALQVVKKMAELHESNTALREQLAAVGAFGRRGDESIRTNRD